MLIVHDNHVKCNFQEDQTIKGDTSGIVQPSVKSTGTTQFDKEGMHWGHTIT